MTAPFKYVVESIRVDEIFIVGERRAVDDGAVSDLTKSIFGDDNGKGAIGLQTPITVRIDESIPDPETGEIMGAYALIAGRHRLEAFRRKGVDRIPAIVRDCTPREAEKWEIIENLHRCDLTAEQRRQCVIRLAAILKAEEDEAAEAAANATENQMAQNAPPEIGYKKPPPQTKGIASKVAEQTGLHKSTVNRILNAPPKRTAVNPREEPEPDMSRVAANLARKYTAGQLQEIVDHLCEVIKDRLAPGQRAA